MLHEPHPRNNAVQRVRVSSIHLMPEAQAQASSVQRVEGSMHSCKIQPIILWWSLLPVSTWSLMWMKLLALFSNTLINNENIFPTTWLWLLAVIAYVYSQGNNQGRYWPAWSDGSTSRDEECLPQAVNYSYPWMHEQMNLTPCMGHVSSSLRHNRESLHCSWEMKVFLIMFCPWVNLEWLYWHYYLSSQSGSTVGWQPYTLS